MKISTRFKESEMLNNSNKRLIVFVIKKSSDQNAVFAQFYRKSRTWTLPSRLIGPRQTLLGSVRELIKKVELSGIKQARVVYDSEILYTKDVTRTILYEVITSGKESFHNELEISTKIGYQGFISIARLQNLKNRTEFTKVYLNNLYNGDTYEHHFKPETSLC